MNEIKKKIEEAKEQKEDMEESGETDNYEATLDELCEYLIKVLAKELNYNIKLFDKRTSSYHMGMASTSQYITLELGEFKVIDLIKLSDHNCQGLAGSVHQYFNLDKKFYVECMVDEAKEKLTMELECIADEEECLRA